MGRKYRGAKQRRLCSFGENETLLTQEGQSHVQKVNWRQQMIVVCAGLNPTTVSAAGVCETHCPPTQRRGSAALAGSRLEGWLNFARETVDLNKPPHHVRAAFPCTVPQTYNGAFKGAAVWRDAGARCL